MFSPTRSIYSWILTPAHLSFISTIQAVHFPTQPEEPKEQPPPPEGESVYDSILPASISFRPPVGGKKIEEDAILEAGGRFDPLDPPSAPEGVPVMPLISFLQEGRAREAGWHRNAERRSRGMFPHSSLSSQLEPWERQLVSRVVVVVF